MSNLSPHIVPTGGLSADQVPAEGMLLPRRRLNFHRLLSEISADLIRLPADDIDGHINLTLGRVGRFLGFNLIAIAKFSGQGAKGAVTHVWTADGLPAVPAGFTELDFPWIAEQIVRGLPVHIATLSDLPPTALADRRTYEALGICCAYNWPLKVGGAVVGCLGLCSIGDKRLLPTVFDEDLERLTQVLASALERARTDHDLRESQARLDLAAAAAGAGLWSLNLSARTYWATRKARDIFGFGADDLLTFDRFVSIVHPGDRDRVRQKVQATVQSNGEGTVEYRIIRADGNVRWILSQGRVERPKSGGPGFLMGVSMDITRQKEAEDAQREAQTTLSAIIDSTDDMIWSVDPNSFGLMTFNRGLRDYFLQHRSINLERGMRPEDLFPAGEYVQRWKDMYRRTLLKGPYTTEYVVYAQSNVLLLSFSLVKQEDEILGVSVFGKDITAQKKAQLDAQELRENLLHLTRVNTLGALSGSLAHELNQPLGIILSNAQAAQEILDQDPPDVPEVQAILKDIVAADRRAGEIIVRLRALLKRGEVKLQPLALNDVIQEVVHLVRADLIGRGVTLSQELAPDLPLLSGDRIQLQQLVLNLILNAMDAMAENPPGARRLHLRTTLHQKSLQVSVRDNGSGLPEDVERLFQPFYTTKAKGLGMGLAICKSIVTAHHGRIWAEPHPEGGAVFRFELPAAGPEMEGKH